MSEFNCSLAQQCAGCPWSSIPFVDQGPRKADGLLHELKSIGLEFAKRPQMVSLGPQGLRDRADLVIVNQQGRPTIGLYHPEEKRITDIADCPQMSPPLAQWFREFRQDLPSIKKGSVRLRVAPDGQRGIWLDFANADIKTLLDEDQWLRRLKAKAIVEIGQRKKRLIEKDGRLKLGDPVLYPWFSTELNGHPTPLFSSIASFTQPGVKANQRLVQTVVETVRRLGGQRWLELFCGLGNFTLPLAGQGLTVTAYEVEELALEGLQLALGKLPERPPLHFFAANAYRLSALPSLLEFDGLLVDPPRSGLKNVLEHLRNHALSARPQRLVYVSCYTPALVQDLQTLSDLGYQIDSITGVDQFPQTPHCEWVVALVRS